MDSRPSDVVTRDSFIELMTHLLNPPSSTGPKVRHLTKLFDEIDDNGVVTLGRMKDLFGDNISLVWGDEDDTYTVQEFIAQFGDLFDDDGNLMDLPPLILEQLRNIQKKFKTLNEDVKAEQDDREHAENTIRVTTKKHKDEINHILAQASEVEEERDSLYAELKHVRKEMARLKTSSPKPPALPPRQEKSPPEKKSTTVTYCEVQTVSSGEISLPIENVEDEEDVDEEEVDAFLDAIDVEMPLQCYEWFVSMGRLQAEKYLSDRNIGAFVVRTASIKDAYALSIKQFHSKYLHYLIACKDEQYALRYVDGQTSEVVGPTFDSVPKLIMHYSEHEINENTPLLSNEREETDM